MSFVRNSIGRGILSAASVISSFQDDVLSQFIFSAISRTYFPGKKQLFSRIKLGGPDFCECSVPVISTPVNKKLFIARLNSRFASG